MLPRLVRSGMGKERWRWQRGRGCHLFLPCQRRSSHWVTKGQVARKSSVRGDTVRRHGDIAWQGDRERRRGEGDKGVPDVTKRPPQPSAERSHCHCSVVLVTSLLLWRSCINTAIPGDVSPQMSPASQLRVPSLTSRCCVPRPLRLSGGQRDSRATPQRFLHPQLTCGASTGPGSVPATSPCKTGEGLGCRWGWHPPSSPCVPVRGRERPGASPWRAPVRDPDGAAGPGPQEQWE